jgi:SAM-dependent methyltransferase
VTAGLSSLARIKRVHVSPGERRAFAQRAKGLLARSGWARGGIRLAPLAVSDSTQTYRAVSGRRSAILKIMPPDALRLSLRVHDYLMVRGINMAGILWFDAAAGALLEEDVGDNAGPAAPNACELAAIVRRLARIHDACVMDEETAIAAFPELAAHGLPGRLELAASVARRFAASAAQDRARVLDAAQAIAVAAPQRPALTISDVKREHFFFRRGEPVLVDLEMASFREASAANLATLLGFPGQFSAPIPHRLRTYLLFEYYRSRTCIDCPFEPFSRAVGAAEFLLSLTLSRFEALRTGQGMVRTRALFAGASAARPVEAELGAACFQILLQKLQGAAGQLILDVGGGCGYAARDIAARWPSHHVFAVDLAPDPRTQRMAAADVRRLPFRDGAFDLVLCIQVLQYVPDKLAAVADVHRVLRPGGRALFAMTEHFGERSAWDPPPARLFRELMRAGIVEHCASHVVDGRRVTAFIVVGGHGEFRAGWEFRSAAARSAFGAAYWRSRYRRSGALAESSRAVLSATKR